MSRSTFATPPSLCSRSTWPRISSEAERIGVFSPMRMPKGRSMSCTMRSMAMRQRPKQRHGPGHGPRRGRARPVSGEEMASVFGSTSAKTITRTDMIDRGVDRALVAEDRDEHARGEGRDADIDDVVADQHRADEALAHFEQAVHQLGALVAALLQHQHAGARGAGERRLARREEGREQEAEDDDQGRKPEIAGGVFDHGCDASSSSCQEGADPVRVDAGRDEALPDAAGEDEGQRAALHLLVLRHGVEKCVDGAAAARNIAEARGQPGGLQMRLDPLGVRRRRRARGRRRSGRRGRGRWRRPRHGRGGRNRSR